MLKIAAVVAVLVVAGLALAVYATGTPQYALYQLRKSAYGDDADTFFRYFDTNRVIANSIEHAVTVNGLPAGPQIVSAKASDMLVPAAEKLLRQKIADRLEDARSIPLLAWKLDGVRYEKNAAFATLHDPNDGSQTTTITLVRGQGRQWKVVDLDLARAGVEFSIDEARDKAETLLDPQMPNVARPAMPPDAVVPELPTFPKKP
jgi:hypothetical protein